MTTSISVYLMPGDSRAKRLIKAAIPKPMHKHVEWVEVTDRAQLPERADYVTDTGYAAPDAPTTRFAMRFTASNNYHYLPEGEVWLGQRLNQRLDAVVIVDSALARLPVRAADQLDIVTSSGGQ